MADALGLAVAVQVNQPVFGDVLQELPEAALLRFNYEEEELRSEIEARIQTWS